MSLQDDSPRRILHVCAVETTARSLLLPQMEFLADHGYDVRLACQPDHDGYHPSLRRFQPFDIRFPRSLDVRAVRRAGTALRRALEAFQPHLVHFHTPAASIPGRLALSGTSTKPVVAYTAHGYYHQWDKRSPKNQLMEFAERFLSRFTDVTMLQAREDYENAMSHGYRGQIVYLGNGVGEEWFEGSRRTEDRAQKLRLLFVGRLVVEKGILHLLEGIRRVPEAELAIIGGSDGTERDAAEAEVQALLKDDDLAQRVRLLGVVPSSEVRRQLDQADLFVLPSMREGLPRSIIEAMARRVPVIATKIRGSRELVTPGVDGWLVDPGDVNELEGAIRSAVSADPARLREMGNAGFRKAFSQYRECQVFDRLLSTYEAFGVRGTRSAALTPLERAP